VTFDLIGLPPTPQEVEDFLKDNSPNAFAKVVDRLLASPHYGERWGRHWLDVVRYTDSLDSRDTGTIRDFNAMWRYRDWVVNALNADMPFNQFVIHQIAGDVLPPPVKGDPNREGIIATGMLAVGHWSNGDADKVKMLTDIADDQIDVVSRGIMGVTLACARCHDHKFDPFTTKDYYGLAGIFLSTHVLPRPAPNDAVETPLKISLLTQQERKEREAYATQLRTALQEYLSAENSINADFVRLKIPETARYLLALWDYAHRPSSQNDLTLEAFAERRRLLPHALKQWADYFREGGYAILQTPRPNVGGYASIYAWAGDTPQDPLLTLNGNMAPRTLGTATYSPLSLGANPGKYGVVVGWKSPIEGYINLAGGLIGIDSQMKQAARWVLSLRTLAGERVLARGEVQPLGQQPFLEGVGGQDLTSIKVERGDSLQLKILPNTLHEKQNVQILLSIVEREGERQWNLFDDVSATFLLDGKGNPHADKLGNSAVWHYYGVGEERSKQEGERAFKGALRRWEASFRGRPTPSASKEREEAAQEVQSRFVAENSSHPFAVRTPEAMHVLPALEQAKLRRLWEQKERLLKSAPPPVPYANGAQEGGCPQSPYAGFQDIPVYKRGNYQNPTGTAVPRGFPEILMAGKNTPKIEGSGRLALAQWLTNASHPLTARVIVNRLWQHHFGEGIVRTPNNFGLLGERPTHPELLDWLAGELVRKGWSLKHLHRLILLSNTYQQSSIETKAAKAEDVENRLLSRYPRRRLQAEAIRDSLLWVSGKLDTRQGGEADREAASSRRTLYRMTVRSERGGFCPLFDAADPTSIVEKRTVTTIAPQALFLMNNDWTREQAGNLVSRLIDAKPKSSVLERIQWLYAVLYARSASAEEIKVGEQFLMNSAEKQNIWKDYAHLLLCTNEFVYID
jgi:hypothetical protein